MDKYTGALSGREGDLSCYKAEFDSWCIYDSHRRIVICSFYPFALLLRVNVCFERKLDLAAQNNYFLNVFS